MPETKNERLKCGHCDNWRRNKGAHSSRCGAPIPFWLRDAVLFISEHDIHADVCEMFKLRDIDCPECFWFEPCLPQGRYDYCSAPIPLTVMASAEREIRSGVKATNCPCFKRREIPEE
jgi:hypothetical protein